MLSIQIHGGSVRVRQQSAGHQAPNVSMFIATSPVAFRAPAHIIPALCLGNGFLLAAGSSAVAHLFSFHLVHNSTVLYPIQNFDNSSMKFARYLEDAQAPEWQKAYIDYRGLKKHISAIRRWQEGLQPLTPSTVDAKDSPSEVKYNSRASWSASEYEGKTPNRRRLSMPTYTRSRPNSQSQPIPLYAILLTLPPIHIAFFTHLDNQLAKIDGFYLEREKEAQSRSRALQNQLRELKDHRKIFYEAHPDIGLSWSATLRTNFQFMPGLLVDSPNSTPAMVSTLRQRILLPTIGQTKPNGDIETIELELGPNSQVNIAFDTTTTAATTTTATKSSGASSFAYAARLDPEEYRYARKKLKKALLEHYRGLEVLNNYRILNITGFRKALKKYQKITKIPVQQAYLKEKVDTSAFSSGDSVGIMLKQAEELFAARFERGDKKRAMIKLRAASPSQQRNYHSSIFRSGIALGLAVPALVTGIYQSFQPERRAQIPAWDVLLFIYGVFMVPVLFSLLLGITMSIWSNSRINYVFIFELDVRTRLDYREYFEIPAILLAALSCALWCSFSHIANPTIWPLVWLGFASVFMLNPLPILFKSSRWWLVKSIGELLISGVHQVEFIDFWMGDQFCSLVFTFSNLYFTFCAYSHNFKDVWDQCGVQSPAGWLMSFTLAMLPLLARAIQSVRRYADSKLTLHLINGGKYGAGIIYYFSFFLWRHHSNSDRGAIFILFCLFGTVYSIYSCSWDFLMDWSFFKSNSRYPLLRSELVYTNALPLYYFALISNVLIKFVWIWYIPEQGPSLTLRVFIGGMLEMLRRWQWNFYRLENEHLGNMDQYRITREMPLPYQIEERVQEDEDDDEESTPRRSWLGWQHRRSTDLHTVYGDDESSV